MKTVWQNYWKTFKCIADKCPTTCCSGWQIVVDDASLEKYEKYDGRLKDRFRESIDFEEGCIRQKNGKDCAFLNRTGLCDMIIAEGDSILCDTCRLYPRHVEEYEGVREWSMSLSCPVIAKMVVESEEEAGYFCEENDEPDPLEDDFEDFDFIFYTKLNDSRDVIFKILRNKKLSLQARIGLIIELATQIQHSFDDGAMFEMDEEIAKFSDEDYLLTHAEEFEVSFSGFMRDDSGILVELERLDEEWDEILDTAAEYPFNEADDLKEFIEGVDADRHDLIFANILESLLYTYYPGAVYNGMVYGYTLMCVFAAIMMDNLAICRFIKKGARLTMEEYEEIVYRYSRETEHSDENISTLLEYFDAMV